MMDCQFANQAVFQRKEIYITTPRLKYGGVSVAGVNVSPHRRERGENNADFSKGGCNSDDDGSSREEE